MALLGAYQFKRRNVAVVSDVQLFCTVILMILSIIFVVLGMDFILDLLEHFLDMSLFEHWNIGFGETVL